MYISVIIKAGEAILFEMSCKVPLKYIPKLLLDIKVSKVNKLPFFAIFLKGTSLLFDNYL